MVTFEVFVRPMLAKLTGNSTEIPEITALAGGVFRSDGRQTYVRVKLHQDGDKTVATLAGNQSSGALMSLVQADGLLVIPAGVREIPIGERARVRLLHNWNYAI
jgi:molybdopterin molybdotransferase